MPVDVDVDVVVIGSGAGGGPLAYTLSRAGAKVLVLEKGPRYTRDEYRHDEIAVHPDRGVFVPLRDEDPHVLVTRDGSRTRTTIGWTARCVGGGTSHTGASLYRFHPIDFALRSHLGAVGSVADWPYGYDELEPYYAIAERAVGVSGSSAGGSGWPRSTPFPQPPLRSNPVAETLQDACRSLGLIPCATPRGINSVPYDNRPACHCCPTCAGYGCPAGARGTTQETVLHKAEASGRCTIAPDVMVTGVTTDTCGLATGCTYVDAAGCEHAVTARVVCVCCSAVESARLLLLSTSRHHPHGLANERGLVGRHLQFHSYSGATGRLSRRTHPAAFTDPNPFLGVSLFDYYVLPTGVTSFAKGGILAFDLQQRGPIASAQAMAAAGGELLWGEKLSRALRDYFHECREAEFEVFHDYFPHAETYVDLDPDVRDRWGLPVARIHEAPLPQHTDAGQWLLDRGIDVLDRLGATDVTVKATASLVGHLVHGTCRAGHDPQSSVLNAFCQSHAVPNLFVVDGSFMPTSGGAPSTLTILANSFRTADYLLEQLRTGAL